MLYHPSMNAAAETTAADTARDLYLVTIADHTVRLQVGDGAPGEAPLVARICRYTDGTWGLQPSGGKATEAANREIAIAWLSLQVLTADVDAAVAHHAELRAMFPR